MGAFDPFDRVQRISPMHSVPVELDSKPSLHSQR